MITSMELELILSLAAGVISALFTVLIGLVSWMALRFIKIQDRLGVVQQDQQVIIAGLVVKVEHHDDELSEINSTLKQLPHVKYNRRP